MNFHPILTEDFRRIDNAIPDIANELYHKKVMITGAGGLIGAYLAEFLVWLNLERNASIRIVCLENWTSAAPDRLSHLGGLVSLLNFDIVWHQIKPTWETDYIFHAASIAAPRFYLRWPMETIKVHVMGTMKMCEHAKASGARMVEFSSVEVYGEPGDVWRIPESYVGAVDPLSERACYSESKRMAETVCMTAHRNEGIKVVIARPFNCYGPGERLDSGRVVPSIVNAGLNGKPFAIYGNGMHSRSYCYLSDVIIQLLCLAVRGEVGQAYNVGDGGSEMTLLSLAETAKRLGIIKAYERVGVEPKGEPTRRRPDTTKILGITPLPTVWLEEGLKRTYDYYRSA